ncbi:MAG: sodium ion-translocating decarboxylase subunit beta [Clostridiales bacterium]|nr:sodium ion-translocating decarboxylase subunit beta [Clostridiales bacterium]
MEYLLEGLEAVAQNPKMIAMWIIGGILIFLAIKKDMEPALLLPMGFGAILVNLPLSPVIRENGIIHSLFQVGISASEAMPLLLFIGIGCMIDFGPLLSNPKLFILGGAAQLGIFITVIFAVMIGFPLDAASSIGIIGAADGPTAIHVANTLLGGGNPFNSLIGPITVVAYSYMALVPIVQPTVMKACTTKKERLIKMKYNAKQVSRLMRILFPIIVTIVSGLIAPESISLVGMLMFGNLLRECGVLKSLSETAQTTFSNIITLLLGITISFQMQADAFISINTLIIMALGLFAFVFDTIGGVLCAKIMNLFCKEKINPLIGAAGISAFPMAARVVEKVGIKEDPSNHLLMHAVGANVSGQIASAIVGGLIIGLVL